ncbi:MAG: OmpH family outer membrane protein [Synergistaceae bacterium]|nr:OmpH family outer membrane protein [Synergistaceae bacterium]
MFKKMCLVVVLLVSLFILVPCAASAAPASGGDKIGVIDSQMVVTKHPKFEAAMKELQGISRKKEDEARLAADKELDEAKKAQVIREKRLELAKEEQRIMEPIIKEAQLAVRTVAKTKGLTVVLEKASVYVGGIDITEDVVQQIKKAATK